MYGTTEIVSIGFLALALIYLIQWLIKRFTNTIDRFAHSIDANTKMTKEVWVLLKRFNGNNKEKVK